MKIILFGASGMVGAGALREALAAPDVEAVLSVGRRSCGVQHAKLRELLLPDLFDASAVEEQLVGYDACLWAVGISSVGLDETAYARVTEELTLKWARDLLRLNPRFSFCYCSAAGAGGRSMWARVRQRVEGTLRSMPFRHVGRAPGLHSPRARHHESGATLPGGDRAARTDLPGPRTADALAGHDVGAARARHAARCRRPGRPIHPRIQRHQPGRRLAARRRTV